jgi:predicted ester cyclase
LVALPYAVAAYLGREVRLGALLSGLCLLNVPFFPIRFWLFPPDPGAYWEPSAAPVLLGRDGFGVSLPEAPLWALLGLALLGAGRGRALARAAGIREKQNLRAARRVYEEGLGKDDPSVVDEMVSDDFRDLRSGACGRLGMERVFADLWASYPDLSVRIEGQEAKGNLVRTRLAISGTDRGRGVMWYPPTGRRVSFCAEFADRFSGGLLVEHAGEADTDGLLEQLGHQGEG